LRLYVQSPLREREPRHLLPKGEGMIFLFWTAVV
jgi:hypothetical protein